MKVTTGSVTRCGVFFVGCWFWKGTVSVVSVVDAIRSRKGVIDGARSTLRRLGKDALGPVVIMGWKNNGRRS